MELATNKEQSINEVAIKTGIETLLAMSLELKDHPTADADILFDENSNTFEMAFIENGTVVDSSPVIYLSNDEAVGQLESLVEKFRAFIRPSAEVVLLNSPKKQIVPGPLNSPAADVTAPLITIYGGGRLNLHKPGQTQFDIEVIAHHLSMICRFGGGVEFFYSVAQHSVHVSHLVPPQMALAGLMHDAAEAFVGDMVKPWKNQLPHFQDVENNLTRHIFEQLGIDWPLPVEIHQADLVALKTERLVLKPHDHPGDWMRLDYLDNDDLEIIQPMTHEQGRDLFLKRYYELQTLSVALL